MAAASLPRIYIIGMFQMKEQLWTESLLLSKLTTNLKADDTTLDTLQYLAVEDVVNPGTWWLKKQEQMWR